MSEDADHVLLTLPRGERGELRLSRSRYQGSTFTKLHLWYPGADGQLHPGRQVVTFRDGEFDQVIDVLSRIRAKLGAPAPVETRRVAPRQRSLPTSGAQPGTARSDEEIAEAEALF